MNRVRVPARYFAEHHTPIEQVEILNAGAITV